jgi:hypothetical protein
LCESHFEKSEIHKGFQVGKDFVPASRNRLLTKDVVPTKNLEGSIVTFLNFNLHSLYSDTFVYEQQV